MDGCNEQVERVHPFKIHTVDETNATYLFRYSTVSRLSRRLETLFQPLYQGVDGTRRLAVLTDDVVLDSG